MSNNTGTKSHIQKISSFGEDNQKTSKLPNQRVKKVNSNDDKDDDTALKNGRIPASELSSESGSHLLSDNSSIFSGFKSNFSKNSAKSLTS